MFLKRLDVMGFKSFAERISIDFVEGVTAVVGPNGSGKSNVTDAIRWVLGEQSAKSLRGAKMEDIIFAGSDSRKSLNFAEVTLTLNNEDQFLPLDYQEVSVTRRVFRSGESEFFINKQSCRLKDIVDLFMDSGLGREAFSIISQGKVEEILSSKAEERRTIFEEAAGVLKYKTRKKKAEQKLIETRENLNRVQDILYELEGQVEPLKIQASMAKDYLEKKQELQQYEVALTVHEIEVLHGKWQELSKQNEEHSNQEMQLSSDLQKKEANIEQLRDRITALDESVSDLQEVLLITTQDLEKLEGRRSVLQERKKNATQSKQQLEQTIEEAQSQVVRLKAEQAEQLQKLEGIQATVKDLKQQLNEKEISLSSFSEDLELEIESLKADYIDLLNEQAAANNEMRMVKQQHEQINARSARLDSENEELLSKRSDITAEKELLISQLKSIKQKLEETASGIFERKTNLEKLQEKYKSEETKLYQAYQYVQQVKSRIEMLKGMEDEYAGFFQGVKEVLKAPNLQGVEGAVAELITVPREYNLAIETALGAAMQHVVVDTEENARKAIQFLKINSFGRATFLPMTVMKERNIPSSQLQLVSNHPSFIGVASQLVRYQSKYAEIVANLLGAVIITSDLKGANELAKKLHYKYRIVTLEGDVVNPGGSMTGGATKSKNYSLLARKGELEELSNKLPLMEEKTVQQETKVKQLKESIQQHTELYESLRANSEQLRIQEESVKGQLREVETNERNLNDRLALYDLDQSSYVEEKLQREHRLAELEQLLGEIAAKLEESKVKIDELTNRKNAQQSSISAVTSELNELKIQYAAKREQQQHAQATYDRLLKDLTEWQRKEEDATEDRKLLFTDMESNTSGEQQLEELAKMKLQDKNETIQLISARREERNQLHMQLEDAERELKEQKRIYKGYVETMKDEEVKINRLDVELENRLQHLQQEYLLSFEDAKEQFLLQDSPEETTKKVKLIKMAIEDLGTINLGAIDEYERVFERFTFLTEQKADLQEAKDTLFQVIDEMDEEMKRRFKETFDGISNEFESVFQQLFGGGRAQLKLTDPDDLLNTGVEIIAQPPGKKLQNLGLLSGGERALTAIALLFSILIVRPVPFCVLDEVEAALDEANVQRFSQYLRKFSTHTQFIVITHRKGTMESADVLYGITMQESGVSKLVSVRLEDKKLAEQTK
ncbi:chromosome segregation protein SMC [Bacillus sp. AGMB 02131]|uniref:Chromosome partition protein Smc n=1 Tax=Peribacillus faecalis TaxID=2772559 RepID=A0A927CRV2_9BACI|nr:chromosome segregation protein SMC [Peribacillus faecalis]MBD3106758.1 chromosome segregation protein SMC [Peribacillus faecalis]